MAPQTTRELVVLEEGETYVIHAEAAARGGRTITCLVCHATSYYPPDVEHRYCGRCRRFHAD